MCDKRVALLGKVLFVKGLSEPIYDFLGLNRLLLTLFAQIDKCLPVVLFLLQICIWCLQVSEVLLLDQLPDGFFLLQGDCGFLDMTG